MIGPRANEEACAAGPAVMVALFLVALATLTFEVLLTRIFSLTMWYHFAFMAIAIAMFGMTLGAIVVFLQPQWFAPQTLTDKLGWSAYGLALSLPVSVLAHIYAPFADRTDGVVALGYTFAFTALPFLFSGVFVCIALTLVRGKLGMLYAADLLGAASGCLAVVALLSFLDGVSAVVACGAIASLAAWIVLRRRTLAWRRASAVTACLYLIAVGILAVHAQRHPTSPFRVRWAKSLEQSAPLLERWNSFSRVTVAEPTAHDPVAWSLGPVFSGQSDLRRYWLTIDAWAGTPIYQFDGDLRPMEFLRWDITNFVHHIVSDARVLIVGAGGGRDILGAKLFGQPEVTAVELNGNIIDIVNGHFGNFSGHLDRDPAVRYVNDEARSYVTRQATNYDIIQLSFIDTWAATAAGAFVLSENALYTVEGWRVFLEHLTHRGILAVSRGVHLPEMYRLVALAHASLKAAGAANPSQHIVLVSNPTPRRPESWGPMALILVGRAPFDDRRVARIEQAASRIGFTVLLKPGWAADATFTALAAGQPSEFERVYPLNLAAPTDDSPFFFNMLRVHQWFRLGRAVPAELINQNAVAVLVNLLVVTSLLTTFCIVLPLELRRRAGKVISSPPLVAYFAAIGLGFMLVEIAAMQRLTVFLGHPVFSLTVILLVLLACGGIGAALSSRVVDAALDRTGVTLLCLGIVALVAFGLVSPWMMARWSGTSTPWRVGMASLLLSGIGVFMGMAFPLGMRVARRSRPELAPWLWGINGATSVLASVLAIVIALAMGISVSYWLGVLCYAAALTAFIRASADGRVEHRPTLA